MVKLLNKLVERLKSKSKQPWAAFEIDGFENDSRVKVNFKWNPAFITKIHSLGFVGETEEESVMLFYYMSQMMPGGETGELPVQSEQHPSLSASNQLKV